MRSPFSVWTACVLVWTLLLVLAESKSLLPYKTPARALPRSTWKREVVPKVVVTLCYAPGLNGRDTEDAYAVAVKTWSSLPQFILVASHPACNPNDQRGVWVVNSVAGEDFKQTISLDVHSIPLRESGSSFHISHVSDNVFTGWRSPSAPKLQSRDVDDIIPISRTFDFAPRQQLLPVDASLHNSSINDSNPGPDPDGLQVFCVDCVSALDFSVGIEMDISDTLSVTAAWINITINDFQHDIDLEISLSESKTFNTVFDVILVPIPDLGVSFHDVATIGFFWGGAIGTDLTISGAVNFTVGASASAQRPHWWRRTWDQSSATGWDEATFDIHPFRLNSGWFSVTAGISLSPFLDATVAFGLGAGSSARLYLNTPHVSGTASVNRDCQPLGPNDFESFADALTFDAGLNISLEGNSSGALLPNDDKIILNKFHPFGDFPTPDNPKCMVFAGDNTASVGNPIAGLLPAATETLLAASVAIHTFNIPGIESYYSAHGALPTNVNYSQMLLATAVPDDIKAAVQQAAASPHKHHSHTGAFAGGVIGGLAAIVLLVIGVWYLRFRRRDSQNFGDWSGGLPKTGPALTPGSQMDGKDYVSAK
ncbi:hypothetical protein B0H14DRAFT_3645890 [Mycena olivaceomarginata]|nr:hypothetical protein B0H14DRAFT_3645890 [Mycena olivaceomarginata]